MAEIYALIDPIEKDVRYIGKANNSIKRLKSHIRDSRRRDTPVYMWIRSLLEKGLYPEVRVICVTDDWVNEEKRLISEYRNKGCNLLNVATGGKEPYCSLEQRRVNGSNIIKHIKNKRLWILKKELALCLRDMKRRGDKDKYNRIIDRMRSLSGRTSVFDSFSHLERI